MLSRPSSPLTWQGSRFGLFIFSSFPGQLHCFFSKDYTPYLFLLFHHAQLLSFAGMNPSLLLRTGIFFIRNRSLYWDFTICHQTLDKAVSFFEWLPHSQHRVTWVGEKACPTPQASWSLDKRTAELLLHSTMRAVMGRATASSTSTSIST